MGKIVKLFLVLPLFLVACTGQSHGDEETLARFFSEAPRAWRSVDSVYDSKSFELDYQEHSTAISAGIDRTSGGKVEVVQLGNLRRESGYLIEGGKLSEEKNFWFIANEDYKANVGKNGADYIIGSVFSFGNRRACVDTESNTQSRPSFCFFESCIFDCIVGMDDFHESEEKKSFVATDATVSTDNSGQEVVTISLMPAEKNSQGEFAIPSMPAELLSLEISLTLIPSRNWCLLAYDKRVEFTSPNGKEVATDECRLKFSGDSCHPSSRQEVMKFSGKVKKTSLICSELVDVNVSPSDFRLTAFNLPEPTGLNSNSNGKIYLFAGFFCISAIAFFAYRRIKDS